MFPYLSTGWNTRNTRAHSKISVRLSIKNWRGWEQLKMIKESIYTRYVSLLVRLLLGGVFIVSSIAKLPMQSRFVDVVQSYQLLPDILASAYGFALPWIELVVGCYLILGILVKPGAVITILMSFSFLVANISSIVRGDSYCPNCFGELVPLTVVQAISFDG